MTGGRTGDGPSPEAGVGRRIGIVVSRFNQPITDRLLEGARRCLRSHGVEDADVEVHHVPGAFELPLAVRWLLDRGEVDGVVALGCVIRGETPHFDYVCLGATSGLERVARERGVPVGFGVLTTDDAEQARARAGGAKGDKGEEAAQAVLDMCELGDVLRRRE